MSSPPRIGISPDLCEHLGRLTVRCATTYADAIARCGGIPLVLVPNTSLIDEYLGLCDGFCLTGGDDPRTEPFGAATDPRTTPVFKERQAFESALLRSLDHRPDTPLLGVCLGMQMMALHEGGLLDQYMPDRVDTASEHWDAEHGIVPEPLPLGGTGPLAVAAERWAGLTPGRVLSKHKQAVSDPGKLVVTARAHDGVIEAVADPDRRFRLGVQWHPERTKDDALGDALFRALIDACPASTRRY